MTLPTSKFNKSDHVWFYNDWHGPKFLEGTINVVHRWENGLGIFYLVNHINQDGTTSEYEVTFYLKMAPEFGWKWMLTVLLGGNIGGLGNLNESGYTWEETEKAGWYKGTAKYVPNADTNFHIANNNGANDPRLCALIDDVSIVKVGGDGTNLIVNGGFEEFTPTSLNITSTETANGQVTLSWTNPIIPATAIKIRIINDGIKTFNILTFKRLNIIFLLFLYVDFYF